MNKIAICFLTRIPNDELIRFANEIITQSKQFDVYIMIDDNSYQSPLSNALHFLQIDNQECVANGFKNSVVLIFEKDCLSWDKALYYFCHGNGKTYDFIWLIEDDVFIPSVEAFITLNEQCYGKGYDLVCQRNHYNLDGNLEPRSWDLWFDVKDKFPLPWYHSMVCAIGLSRQLLKQIDQYVKTRGFLPFIEYMFNTIAMHAELHVHCPPELSTINYRYDWLLKEIKQQPMNWYHPMKDFEKHRRFREKLANPVSIMDDDELEQEQNEYAPDCFCLQPPNI